MTEDAQPDRLKNVPWPAVGFFVLVSFGLAWLIIVPLWLNDADSSVFGELSGILPKLMMYSPLVAVVVVYWARAPRDQRLRFLGVWPMRPTKRVVGFRRSDHAIGPRCCQHRSICAVRLDAT